MMIFYLLEQDYSLVTYVVSIAVILSILLTLNICIHILNQTKDN